MPSWWVPAQPGSATIALLAEKGRDVLVLEKEKVSPLPCGESLMPFCYFPLRTLGLVDQLMESGNLESTAFNLLARMSSFPALFIFFNTLIIHPPLPGRFGGRF